MHQLLSLDDLTLPQAVEALAKLAADRRGRPLSFVEKQALDQPGPLASIGSALQSHPTGGGALLGAGLGGLLGAGSALMGGDDWATKRKKALRNLFTGGLAGAAVGGGLGMASGHLPGLGGPKTTDHPGSFTNPLTGEKMEIDPKMLAQHPDLLKQVSRLTTPSPQTQVGDAIGAGAGAALKWAPATAVTGTGIGLHEGMKSLGGHRLFTEENLRAGLGGKGIENRMTGGKGTLDAIRQTMARSGGAGSLLHNARGGSWWERMLSGVRSPNGASIIGHGNQPAFNPENPLLSMIGDRQVAGPQAAHGIPRGDVNELLRAGRTSRLTEGAKIPSIAKARNLAMLGTAGAVDLGRNYLLGHMEDSQNEEQLKALMSQIAHESAKGGK